MVLPVSTTLSLPLSAQQLDEINAHLFTLGPQEVLAWGINHLPNLFQSTGTVQSPISHLLLMFLLTILPVSQRSA